MERVFLVSAAGHETPTRFAAAWLGIWPGAFKTDSYNVINSRFTGRIVFPYIDTQGITRYFTARETPLTPRWTDGDGKDFTPKYVKLPVHKEVKDGDDDGISPAVQNVIWTTHETPKKQRVGIIAEGVADAISAAQAGYAVRSPVTTTFKGGGRRRQHRLHHLGVGRGRPHPRHGVQRVGHKRGGQDRQEARREGP